MRPFYFDVYDTCLQCLLMSLLVKSQTTESSSGKDARFPSADPSVALEGQCVVVCDAVQSQRVQTQATFAPTAPTARRIAFSVQKNANLGLPRNPGGAGGPVVVTFDYMLLNIGNAFDSSTSTFVPSVSGVYSLDFNIYKLFNRDSVTVALTINGVVLFTAFAGDKSAPPQLAHNGGLAHLDVNDRVRIEIVKGNLDGGWQHSTFSGHLLFEDRY